MASGVAGAQRSPPPLVINTMGWVKGFGLSLLRDVTVAASPSHLFSLCSGNPRKDVATSSPWMLEGVCGVLPHRLLVAYHMCGGKNRLAMFQHCCSSFSCCNAHLSFTTERKVQRETPESEPTFIVSVSAVAEQCGIQCMELPCIGAVAAANPSGGMHVTHASESPGGPQLPKPQSHSATDDRNSRLHAWLSLIHI